MQKLQELKFFEPSDKLAKRRFNKVDFLTKIGFISSRFNHDTLKFENSVRHRMNACFMAFVKANFCLKFSLSNLFEREDTIQLWIGNVTHGMRSCCCKCLTSVLSIDSGLQLLRSAS